MSFEELHWSVTGYSYVMSLKLKHWEITQTLPPTSCVVCYFCGESFQRDVNLVSLGERFCASELHCRGMASFIILRLLH